jgi:lysozyme
MNAVAFFNSARALKRELTGNPAATLSQEDVDLLNSATAARWRPIAASPVSDSLPAPSRTSGRLTARAAMELISHEAIVPEAYKDSVGVWTWGIGVTNASGHTVYPRYKDNPQSIRKCLEVFIWLLCERYIPAVEKAFAGKPLTEAQFAAALSFHYNTGAIAKADWVAKWKRGDVIGARAAIMNWRKPPEIIPRREKERDLFFEAKWSSDGKATVYPVKKPSYSPDWRAARRVDVLPVLQELLR